MPSVFETLQSDIVSRLLSDTYFSDITVQAIAEGTVSSDLLQHAATASVKAGKTGVYVGVLMPSAATAKPNTPGPQMRVMAKVRVMESPQVNRYSAAGTAKTAEAICVAVIQLLHHWCPNDGVTLIGGEKLIEPSDPETSVEGMVSYDLTFELPMFVEPPLKVQCPTATEKDGLLTLANLTDGATIYYTLDGTFPYSGNPAAIQYTTPFALSVGQTIRWAAYKEGMKGSNVGTATVT